MLNMINEIGFLKDVNVTDDQKIMLFGFIERNRQLDIIRDAYPLSEEEMDFIEEHFDIDSFVCLL